MRDLWLFSMQWITGEISGLNLLTCVETTLLEVRFSTLLREVIQSSSSAVATATRIF